ncbi:YraN family protein [Desulforamulus ruminis]|uniref:UPF0102 protein Desru_1819 n=1 Tax=Desulforamulus ruminis (strain ATCC 23193 / DSM 2154 / NCIMB 8452 / DL) TaxID=696281 RepID=F6DTM0_DESRL|nr:YraN family protein [Desulforamulus ruminis]AEG60082.1 Uncharacterized protein family UPF0102 [Desulforamulus ruminis DSM 2154]
MDDTRKALGNRGEEVAAGFLRQLGWKIIERNYRCRMGELDMVATDDQGVLVFVEVRTRSGSSHGLPEESVLLGKQKRLRMLAEYYLLLHPEWRNKPCRFDVLAVQLAARGEIKTVRHIKNAF